MITRQENDRNLGLFTANLGRYLRGEDLVDLVRPVR